MHFIRNQNTIEIKRTDFRLENLPPHCFMNFRLMDEHGRQLELERNLNRLRAEYGSVAREAFQSLADKSIQTSSQKQNRQQQKIDTTLLDSGPYQNWSFADLPQTIEIQRGSNTLQAYPALIDRKTEVTLEILDDPQEAKRVHHQGLRRLYALVLKDNVKALQKQLPHGREIGLLFMQIGSVDELIENIILMAIERAFMQNIQASTKAEFEESIAQGKPRFVLIAGEIAKHVLSSMQEYSELNKKLNNAKALSSSAYEDIRQQLQGLIHQQFLKQTPYEYLVHLPRYLKAIALRIDKLRTNPSRDAQMQRDWESIARAWQKMVQVNKGAGQYVSDQDQRLKEFRWQLEELRVALFAQELRTPTPMSVKRLEKILASLR